MIKSLLAMILQNDGLEGLVKYIDEEKRVINRSYFLTICLFVTITTGAFIKQENTNIERIESLKDSVLTDYHAFCDSLQNYVDTSGGIHIVSGINVTNRE